MNVDYPVLVNGVVQYIQSPYPAIRGVVIHNYSGDNLLFDDTVRPLLVVPPGVTVPINIQSLVSTIRIRSVTNTIGYATITLSDTPYDTTNAPALQQLPGNVSITGTVVIPSAVTTTPQAGSVQTIAGAVTPGTGFFASTKAPLVVPANGSAFILFAYPVDRFSILFNIINDACIHLYLDSGWNNVFYLLYNKRLLYNGTGNFQPPVMTYNLPVTSGTMLVLVSLYLQLNAMVTY